MPKTAEGTLGPDTAKDILRRMKKIQKKKALQTDPGKASDGSVKKKKKRKKTATVVLKTALPGASKVKREKSGQKVAKRTASDPSQLGIVTRAGIRRCATRVGIRCIQRDTVNLLKDTIEDVAKELFARARSNAYHISRTKTLRMVDIASAARNMGLGDVVS